MIYIYGTPPQLTLEPYSLISIYIYVYSRWTHYILRWDSGTASNLELPKKYAGYEILCTYHLKGWLEFWIPILNIYIYIFIYTYCTRTMVGKIRVDPGCCEIVSLVAHPNLRGWVVECWNPTFLLRKRSQLLSMIIFQAQILHVNFEI